MCPPSLRRLALPTSDPKEVRDDYDQKENRFESFGTSDLYVVGISMPAIGGHALGAAPKTESKSGIVRQLSEVRFRRPKARLPSVLLENGDMKTGHRRQS